MVLFKLSYSAIVLVGMLTLISLGAFGQHPSTQSHLVIPSTADFEAAVVKAAPLPKDGRYAIGYFFSNATFRGNYISLRQCIEAAYNIPSYIKISGPDWIDSDSFRFSIVAKAASNVPETRLREMLQHLLAERFHLEMHTEIQQLPIYALVRGKSALKLTPVEYDGPDLDRGIRPSTLGLEAKHTSMAVLANVLGGRTIHLDRPVIDMTGLKGSFDFSLQYATGSNSTAVDLESPDNPNETIFTAIQKLGLKLEARKGDVTIYVVDSASRIPVDN